MLLWFLDAVADRVDDSVTMLVLGRESTLLYLPTALTLPSCCSRIMQGCWIIPLQPDGATIRQDVAAGFRRRFHRLPRISRKLWA